MYDLTSFLYLLLSGQTENSKMKGRSDMLTKNIFVKGIVAVITFVTTMALTKVVIRSLGDAFKTWGILGTLLFFAYMGAIVLSTYMEYGLKISLYSVLCILFIHCSLWAVGSFK